MDGIQNQNQGTPNSAPQPQNPSAPPAPQNQQQFSPPPPAEMNLRTPESDMRSISRGDAMPIPESVMAPENMKDPVFRPETQTSGMTEIEDESAGGKKKVVMWIVIALAVVLVGGAGYFFVYPLLFPTAPPEVSIEGTTPPPAPVALTHQSSFIGAVGVTSDVILPDLFQKTIIDNFANSAKFKQPDGTIQEIVFKDSLGNQVPFKSFLNAFAPALTVDMLTGWFEDDFTSFVYYDKDGAWPGVVGRIKNGANIDAARVALSALEGADTAGFYLTPPGAFDPFKDGSVGIYPTRYARASLPGASFNYGIAGNYFLVSTSYNGLKEAVSLLGL